MVNNRSIFVICLIMQAAQVEFQNMSIEMHLIKKREHRRWLEVVGKEIKESKTNSKIIM